MPVRSPWSTLDDNDWGNFDYILNGAAANSIGEADVGITHDVTGSLDGNGNDNVLIDTVNNQATTFNAGSGNDVLIAGNGNDVLNGENGIDLLVGGTGSDRMSGGSGKDTFLWLAGDQGAATAGTGTATYGFAGVTQANDVGFAYEFSVNTTSFANLNALTPSSNTNFVARYPD